MVEVSDDGVRHLCFLSEKAFGFMFFCFFSSQLNLQSLNQARSAFVIFRFTHKFFNNYNRGSENFPKVQVPVKACVAVFKAVSSVDLCDIIIDDVENTLLFVLHCKHSVEKTYKLSVEQSTTHKGKKKSCDGVFNGCLRV